MGNYMKEVAALLGVELGERFKVKAANIPSPEAEYAFGDDGLWAYIKCKGYSLRTESADWLEMLLTGEAEIIRLPWRPKMGERYYFWHDSLDEPTIGEYDWDGTMFDVDKISMGNCFRSREEAVTNKDKVIATYKAVLEGLQNEQA